MPAEAHFATCTMPVPIIQPPGGREGAGSQVVFGVFGSLERHKRVPAAVRAFAKLHRSFPSKVRLVIAGRLDNPSRRARGERA